MSILKDIVLKLYKIKLQNDNNIETYSLFFKNSDGDQYYIDLYDKDELKEFEVGNKYIIRILKGNDNIE